MAFLVEDGTGLSGATSYISVAFFRAYWADVGITFAQLDPALQAPLIQATRYIETRYAGKFKGDKLNPTVQALSWPRQCVYDVEGCTLLPAMPARLQAAAAEYANRALTAPLAPDPTVAGNVSGSTEQVGPIVETLSFFGPTPLFQPYPLADSLLATLLRAAGSYSYR